MCVAVCCSVLQCVAVCGSVLQCVAACCSVLQRAVFILCFPVFVAVFIGILARYSVTTNVYCSVLMYIASLSTAVARHVSLDNQSICCVRRFLYT